MRAQRRRVDARRKAGQKAGHDGGRDGRDEDHRTEAQSPRFIEIVESA